MLRRSKIFKFTILFVILISLGVVLLGNKTSKVKLVKQSPVPTALSSKTSQPNQYAIHGFIFANYPIEAKTYLFDAAKRTGKTLIRFDFARPTIEKQGKFDFTKQDENMKLAKDRGLEVVGILGQSTVINSNDLQAYNNYIKQTVRHYPQVKYWEVWNEPNSRTLYANNPAGFARILKVSYQTIKETNPQALVLFPGVIFDAAWHQEWTKKVLEDPDNPGKNSYDIANVHIRGSLEKATNNTKIALEGFRKYGLINAPLWITEFGYSAEPYYQSDPQFKGSDVLSGEQAQANYYQATLPVLVSMGVDKVFVTLRDNEADKCGPRKSPFCYEGMVTFGKDPTKLKDRPAMAVFQSL
ncbi:hypothetical protein HYW43_04095 [Candidatus Daviesbacteria bacterium]|nr:hypothetical protein [Candidatus Daviesbacteria bacterium]